jgi:hypothetical protein
MVTVTQPHCANLSLLLFGVGTRLIAIVHPPHSAHLDRRSSTIDETREKEEEGSLCRVALTNEAGRTTLLAGFGHPLEFERLRFRALRVGETRRYSRCLPRPCFEGGLVSSFFERVTCCPLSERDKRSRLESSPAKTP